MKYVILLTIKFDSEIFGKFDVLTTECLHDDLPTQSLYFATCNKSNLSQTENPPCGNIA